VFLVQQWCAPSAGGTSRRTVLTRNIRGYDLMNQILPEGRVLFYRAS
jgi:hypothetical protein